MLSSIHPLGERVRHNRWSITVTAYLAGSVAGGAMVGAAAGAIGRAAGPLPGRAIATAAVVAAVLATELLMPGQRLPGPSRQVNEDWLVRYRGWVYGAGFGLQLGAGVLTQITTAAVYGWIVLAAVTGRAGGGAVVGVVYGIVRALPILLMGGVTEAEQLRRFHLRFQRILAMGRWR